MSIGSLSDFCNMSKCAVTLLHLTTFQLLNKFIKQRYKLALNLRVDFLRGCIIINMRGLVAGIQQCNPRQFASELKALNYTIANDFGRILLIRLHAFMQALVIFSKFVL